MTNTEIASAIAATFDMITKLATVDSRFVAMNVHLKALLEIQRNRAAEPEFKIFE